MTTFHADSLHVYDDETKEDILEEDNINNEEIHISRINITPSSTPTSGSNKKARYDSNDATIIASFDKWMKNWYVRSNFY